MSDYYGLPTESLSSPYLRVEYLANAGPRIVRLELAGNCANLLAESPGVCWPTPFGPYHLRGGHRLWHAPEGIPRSSVPDEGPLTIAETSGGVRLCPQVETFTGIRKLVEIELAPDRAALTIRHELRNEGAWPVELAAWAITQLPRGGAAVLPQLMTPVDVAGLAPNRNLAIWPYTRLADPRLELNRDDYWLVHTNSEAAAGACKIGYFNRLGWCAYVHDGLIFCKRFQVQPDRPHADGGCNVEVYTCSDWLELETLGPVQRLEPGQATLHVETWEIYAPGRPLPPDLSSCLLFNVA